MTLNPNPHDRKLLDGPCGGQVVRVVLPQSGIIKIADNRAEQHHLYRDTGFGEWRYLCSVPYKPRVENVELPEL